MSGVEFSVGQPKVVSSEGREPGGFRIDGMNRYGIDGANRRAMAAGKRAITADNGLAPLHGYRLRWTNLDAQAASDTFFRLDNRRNGPIDHSPYLAVIEMAASSAG
jgi:hypothetical protein